MKRFYNKIYDLTTILALCLIVISEVAGGIITWLGKALLTAALRQPITSDLAIRVGLFYLLIGSMIILSGLILTIVFKSDGVEAVHRYRLISKFAKWLLKKIKR